MSEDSISKEPKRINRRNFLRIAGGTIAGLVLNKVFPDSVSAEGPPAKEYRYLNGGCLISNHHELLFLDDINVVNQDIAYTARMGARVLRVFATDANFGKKFDGETVAKRIAAIAPALRANNLKLIVSLVNNHQAVPGEDSSSVGHFDGYTQLTEDFYKNNWQGAYKKFVTGLIKGTIGGGNRDVIFAWEVGNELHTPRNPRLFFDFFKQAVGLIYALDKQARISPGTMGINHLEPGNPQSQLGVEFYRYLASIKSFVTLHCYDFVTEGEKVVQTGDMPVNWDLDLVSKHKINVPVVAEELGFSKVLVPFWQKGEQHKRAKQEVEAIRYLLGRGVIGFGPWSACLTEKAGDSNRGLSSYPGQSIFQRDNVVSERSTVENAYKNLPQRP